jgi:hypothetical protein
MDERRIEYAVSGGLSALGREMGVVFVRHSRQKSLLCYLMFVFIVMGMINVYSSKGFIE